MQLREVTIIQSGIYAATVPKGDVFYLQARHFDQNHEVVQGVEPDLKGNEKMNKHYLQPGDILIAAKGKEHYAIEYNGYPAPAVASTIFIVVRILEKNILLPSFLKWYFNLARIQKGLSDGAQGSVIPVISKADLESLEIQIPPIETQNVILKIDQLRQKELKLTHQIESLKNKIMEQELLNAISN